MSAVRPLMIALLFALTSLAAMPMAAQAQGPLDCFPGGAPNVPCLQTVTIPSGGNPTGGSDDCGLDSGAPVSTGVPGAPPVPTFEPNEPCWADFASITFEGDDTIHIHFFAPQTIPSVFSDGNMAVKDLYISEASDLDGDGDDDGTELFSCLSNPFNPKANCEDADGDGLEYYTLEKSSAACAADGGVYSSGECTVDEETDCPRHDPGESCDPNNWNTDGDAFGSDKVDTHPTDPDQGRVNTDGDDFWDDEDNCPTVDQGDSQADFDNDGRGDACDDDIDGDGTPNATDPCPKDAVDDCLNVHDSADGCFNSDVCMGSICDSDFFLDDTFGCVKLPNVPEEYRFLNDQPWYCDPTDSHATGPYVGFVEALIFDDDIPTPPDVTAVPDQYGQCEYPVPIGPPGEAPDVCEDVFEVPGVCGDLPDPCDLAGNPPVICGGAPPVTVPYADLKDPWDTDGDNKVNEPNGQPDFVEQRVGYLDADESRVSSSEKNKDLEGSGQTLVVFRPALTGTGVPIARVHVGDAKGSQAQESLIVHANGLYVCVYTVGGEVRVAQGTSFNSASANPCGTNFSAVGTLDANGVSLLHDDDLDNVPESYSTLDTESEDCGVTPGPVAAPNPASCPWSDPQPLGVPDPSGLVPDPQAVVDELCADGAILAESVVCGGEVELPCNPDPDPLVCVPAGILPCDPVADLEACFAVLEELCFIDDETEDALDLCPSEEVPCGNDSDGDGVCNDGTDECPTQAAATPNGCPAPVCGNDSDGDGVCNDGTDECPTQAANTANGCPAPTAPDCTLEDIASMNDACNPNPEALVLEIQGMIGDLVEGTDPFAELPQCEDVEDLDEDTYVCVHPPVRPLARFIEPLGVEWPGLLVHVGGDTANGLKLNL